MSKGDVVKNVNRGCSPLQTTDAANNVDQLDEANEAKEAKDIFCFVCFDCFDCFDLLQLLRFAPLPGLVVSTRPRRDIKLRVHGPNQKNVL